MWSERVVRAAGGWAVLLSLSACAGQGEASARVTGKGQRGGTPEVFDFDQGFQAGHIEATPDFQAPVNAHVASFGPVEFGAFGLSTLSVYIGAADFHLGPSDGSVSLEVFGNRAGQALVGTGRTVVTDLRFTGDGTFPVEVSGTFAVPRLANNIPGNDVSITEGRFTYRPRCDDSVGASRWFGYCGGTVPNGWSARFLAPELLGADGCPAAVKELFVGTDGLTRFEGGRIAGNGMADLPCARVRGGNNVICGATRYVTGEGGCRWKAAALVSVSGNASDASQSGATWLMSGTVESGCDDVGRWCATSARTMQDPAP